LDPIVVPVVKVGEKDPSALKILVVPLGLKVTSTKLVATDGLILEPNALVNTPKSSSPPVNDIA
jgi:hypothetical protein